MGVDGGAAGEVLVVGQVVGDGIEDFDGGGGHFGADPVTGQESDRGHVQSSRVTGPGRSRSRS